MGTTYANLRNQVLVLQVDDPQLASHWAMHPEIDVAECRKWASGSVELLNHALRGIPPERVRYHTCYSINMGPRVHDIELKHIVDIMLGVQAGPDCGFASFSTSCEVHPSVVWAKLATLAEGARLATGESQGAA
jgi:5-methyltetrahydropteroyltriglutamate--homocysteine methyltransferase